MPEPKGRLQFNPEPIKVVPDAVRDVWTKSPGWRCEYEDGRGRCRSRDTTTRWFADERRAVSYCDEHWPFVSRPENER